MTGLVSTTRTRPGTLSVAWADAAPVLAGVGAAALRMTWAGRGLGSDEAGFLVVAHQWAPGPSLYGRYWVDRPPLLISLYQLADEWGGAIGLRVLGAAAVVLTVLLVGAIARRATGSAAAAAVASVCAAALLASPAAGAYEVNGELLAAPFVASGVLGILLAVTAGPDARRQWAGGALAGAGGVAAVLVKQNMVDVAVVAGIVVLAALVRRRLAISHLLRSGLAAVLAGAGVVLLVLGWSLAHGTSVGGVWWAMYPFRLAAAHALAGSPGLAAHHRGLQLAGAAVTSGIVPALVALGLVLGSRGRTRRLEAVVLVAWIGWVAVSILVGGNFWGHYLVQLAVPTALGAGLVAAVRPRVAAAVVVLCLVPAVVSTAVVLTRWPAVPPDERIGRAVGQASRASDTVVVAWGHAEVVRASGLPSPYPSLWSLPTKVLDPDLTGLDRVLRGPEAPTWFVVRGGLRSWGLSTSATATLLHDGYHRVARLCDASVYLRDGLDRPVPTTPCD